MKSNGFDNNPAKGFADSPDQETVASEEELIVLTGPVAYVLREVISKIQEMEKSLQSVVLLCLDQEGRLEKLGAATGETLTFPKGFKEMLAKAKGPRVICFIPKGTK